MFENFSREQALRITSFLVMGLMLFGVDLSQFGLTEDSLAEFLVTGVLVVGMLIDFIGYLIRWAKGDVNAFGGRTQ